MVFVEFAQFLWDAAKPVIGPTGKKSSIVSLKRKAFHRRSGMHVNMFFNLTTK